MLHTIQKLIGKSKKELYFPIFLMCIDSLGSMALYFVLYLTVLDLFFGTLTMNKIGIYTLVCLLGVIYRIIVYRKSYLLCFERAFNVTGQFRIKLADHFRKLSLGYFNQNSTGYLINTMTNDMGSFEGVLSHALSFLMKTVTLCGLILVGTFFINWKLALAECVVLLFAVPLLRWGNRLVEQLGTKKRTMTARMVSTVMEYIKGIKIGNTVLFAVNQQPLFQTAPLEVCHLVQIFFQFFDNGVFRRTLRPPLVDFFYVLHDTVYIPRPTPLLCRRRGA